MISEIMNMHLVISSRIKIKFEKLKNQRQMISKLQIIICPCKYYPSLSIELRTH